MIRFTSWEDQRIDRPKYCIYITMEGMNIIWNPTCSASNASDRRTGGGWGPGIIGFATISPGFGTRRSWRLGGVTKRLPWPSPHSSKGRRARCGRTVRTCWWGTRDFFERILGGNRWIHLTSSSCVFTPSRFEVEVLVFPLHNRRHGMWSKPRSSSGNRRMKKEITIF